MKSFSKKYLDRLSFGEVRHTDQLVHKFKVSKFPTLMVITDINNYEGEVYEGEMKVDLMQKFLSLHANSAPKKLLRKA